MPVACQSGSKAKAAYRFFDHPETQMDVLLKPHCEATEQRIAAEKVVLAVQDTTSLNYNPHPATENLDPIGSEEEGIIGLLVHSTMTFNLEGTPLGLLDVQCWARDAAFGKKHERKRRPIEEKQSSKWLTGFRQVAEVQRRSPGTRLVSVGDRESDLYELFHEALKDPQGPWLLIRAECDRRLAEGQQQPVCWVEQQPVAGIQEIQVPRHGTQAARVALGGAICTGQPANAEGQEITGCADTVGGAVPRSGSAVGDRSPALDAADHLPGGELRGRLPDAALVYLALGN
jgi:hypothetical protein